MSHSKTSVRNICSQETSLLLQKLSTELNQINLIHNLKKHFLNGNISSHQDPLDAIMIKNYIIYLSQIHIVSWKILDGAIIQTQYSVFTTISLPFSFLVPYCRLSIYKLVVITQLTYSGQNEINLKIPRIMGSTE